ncbi:MAG: CvpA family protein [Verrucomicrobiota bacterium]
MSNGFPVTLFDFVVIVVAVVGLVRGRRRGMSQEFLDLVAWLGFVFAGAYVCRSYGKEVARLSTLSLMWSNIIAYLATGCVILFIIYMIKTALRDRIAQCDFFGSMEYPLGMMSGIIRFLCILVVVISVIHAPLITEHERAKTAKLQSDAFGNISFPTLGEIQQTIFADSFAGKHLGAYLDYVLIPKAAEGEAVTTPRATEAQQKENLINQIIGK